MILQICGTCHDDANDPGFEFEVKKKIEKQRHGTLEPGTGKPKAKDRPPRGAARGVEELLAQAFAIADARALMAVAERPQPSASGGVATLTIDREAKRNALDRATLDELEARSTRPRADPEVRVIVLRGAGDRAFCAGADLAELQGHTHRSRRAAATSTAWRA